MGLAALVVVLDKTPQHCEDTLDPPLVGQMTKSRGQTWKLAWSVPALGSHPSCQSNVRLNAWQTSPIQWHRTCNIYFVPVF